jgi:hypothetical protein
MESEGFQKGCLGRYSTSKSTFKHYRVARRLEKCRSTIDSERERTTYLTFDREQPKKDKCLFFSFGIWKWRDARKFTRTIIPVDNVTVHRYRLRFRVRMGSPSCYYDELEKSLQNVLQRPVCGITCDTSPVTRPVMERNSLGSSVV